MDNGVLRMVIMQLNIDKHNKLMINLPLKYRSIQWNDTNIPGPEKYLDVYNGNVERAVKTYNQILMDKNIFDTLYMN